MNRSLAVLVVAVLALGACTWVPMEPGAARVQVLAANASASGCTQLGEIAVSVKDRVGLYERSELKVRDELETLARNEAVDMGADAIRPLDEPVAGEQRFLAFRCGAAMPARSRPTTQSQAPANQPLQVEDVQTFPVQDD